MRPAGRNPPSPCHASGHTGIRRRIGHPRGGVDHARHRGGRDRMHLASSITRCPWRTGDGGNAAPGFALAITLSNSSPGTAPWLRPHCEQDIHILVQQMQKLIAEATDAEGIRQRQCTRPPRPSPPLALRDACWRSLRPQIAFDIEQPRIATCSCPHRRAPIRGRRQIGAHAALAVGRYRIMQLA